MKSEDVVLRGARMCGAVHPEAIKLSKKPKRSEPPRPPVTQSTESDSEAK